MLLQRKQSIAPSAIQSGALDHALGQSALRGIQSSLASGSARPMDRRSFLKRSGVGAGAGAIVAGGVSLPAVNQVEAQETKKIEIKRTVCTHCSVGCAIDAVVENGVWVRQEPVFDSPINLGAHCAKGAAIREHGHGEYRLKQPMKLVNGKYVPITWEVALKEVAERIMALKKTSGPDSVFWVGSSKHNNEQAYLLRKFVSFFGSNNCDHQARICHSTTVAGVANTWYFAYRCRSLSSLHNPKC